MTAPRYTTELWQQWYVLPAPDTVACAGIAPELFEFAGTHAAIVQTNAGVKAKPSGAVAVQIATALAVCATCPLATRDWCLDAVRPKQSGVSIIAGGAVWSRGRRVWTIEKQRRLEDAA